MKIIISGGGTGGHIYPAIAIADALKATDPTTSILFVGAKGRMEMEKVPQAGYPIEGLWISGLQRGWSLKAILQNVGLPFKVVHSYFKARQLLRRFQPDVVVGVGGYASAFVVRAAQAFGIPTLLQEQNGYAGITNRWLSRKAAKICVAYPNMEKYFPKEKIVFTGNPVRKDLTNLESLREQALSYFGFSGKKPIVLVLGGSLGARTINQSVSHALSTWVEKGIDVLWQTGKYYFQTYESQRRAGVNVLPFIDRMDLAYACAEVVVSRAGALSISEICLAAKPAILIPSPNVAEDHQTKNALALVEKNAAILIKDHEAIEKLGSTLVSLINNEPQKNILRENIRLLARPDAVWLIVEEIKKLARKNL